MSNSKKKKRKKNSLSVTFELNFEVGCSTASWPWCNIVPFQSVHACRRYHNGPPFTSYTKQGHVRQCKLSFLHKKTKNRTLAPSIPLSQCSVQSMAVTDTCYHFVVHFYHFIDRPLFLFALLYMIIIILLTDTFILLYIFSIGGLKNTFSCMAIVFSDVISK